MHLRSKKGVDIYHEFYLDLQLKNMPTPETAKLPIGELKSINKWNKTVGDRINKYDVIAYLYDDIPIYSPFSGELTEIASSPKMGDYSDFKYAVIKTREEDIPTYPLWHSESNINREAFLEIIKKAAIVDEIRKQYLYFTLKKYSSCEKVIIDGFDDQPYNLSKTATALNYKNEVYEGARILAKVFGAEKLAILMGKNFQTQAFLKTYDEGVEKITVEGKYPTEPVINKYCSDNLAFRISAPTCRAIYRAVFFGEADLSRIVTIWGDGISEPSVAEIPFGVPIENILKEFCAFGMIERVISGGVMMGYVASINYPMYVWDSSLTVMPLKKHHPTVQCINCGRCAISCPLGLAPYYLVRNSKNRGVLKAKQLCAGLCIYCGACAYICPSRIPLVDLIKNFDEKGKS